VVFKGPVLGEGDIIHIWDSPFIWVDLDIGGKGGYILIGEKRGENYG
jgi:hypothetical protein